MHWRQMMDSEFVGAWDIMDEEGNSRDVVVVIDRVESGEVTNEAKKTSRKPLIYFKGRKKPLVCNVTNAKTISRLYGNNVLEWPGKPVTLYVGEASVGGEVKPAIRVRPVAPKTETRGKANGAAKPPEAPSADDRQPGEEG